LDPPHVFVSISWLVRCRALEIFAFALVYDEPVNTLSSACEVYIAMDRNKGRKQQHDGISNDGRYPAFVLRENLSRPRSGSEPSNSGSGAADEYLSGDSHTGINEQEFGPRNPGMEVREPDSMCPP
jgi:hypothetical protein